MAAVFLMADFLFHEPQRYRVAVIFAFAGGNTSQNTEDQIADDGCEPEEKTNNNDCEDRRSNHGKDDSDLKVERFLALIIDKPVFVFLNQPENKRADKTCKQAQQMTQHAHIF